ncbi:MAG: hypothetical protein AABZ44_00250, partial [Elusimicrobiota bacterium]
LLALPLLAAVKIKGTTGLHFDGEDFWRFRPYDADRDNEALISKPTTKLTSTNDPSTLYSAHNESWGIRVTNSDVAAYIDGGSPVPGLLKIRSPGDNNSNRIYLTNGRLSGGALTTKPQDTFLFDAKDVHSILFSPDNHWAVILSRQGNSSIIRPDGSWTYLPQPVSIGSWSAFSPDGTRFATAIKVSPDSNRVKVFASNGNYVNLGPSTAAIDHITYAANGTLGYQAMFANGDFRIVTARQNGDGDHHAGPAFAQTAGPWLTDDGIPVYEATTDGKTKLMIGHHAAEFPGVKVYNTHMKAGKVHFKAHMGDFKDTANLIGERLSREEAGPILENARAKLAAISTEEPVKRGGDIIDAIKNAARKSKGFMPLLPLLIGLGLGALANMSGDSHLIQGIKWLSPFLSPFLLAPLAITLKKSPDEPTDDNYNPPEPKDLLEAFFIKIRLPVARWPKARERVDALWKIAAPLTHMFGADATVELRLGPWWMTVKEPGKITMFIPIEALVDEDISLDVIAGGIFHEGGHVEYTITDGPEFAAFKNFIKNTGWKEQVFHLFNVLEDARIEKAKLRTLPGGKFYLDALARHYDKELLRTDHSGNTPTSDKETFDIEEFEKLKKIVPAIEFLDAMFRLRLTGIAMPDNEFVNPKALEKFKIALPHAIDFIEALPEKTWPNKREKIRAQAKAAVIFMENIAPHFIELLEESRDNLKNMPQQPSAQGTQKSQGDKGDKGNAPDLPPSGGEPGDNATDPGKAPAPNGEAQDQAPGKGGADKDENDADAKKQAEKMLKDYFDAFKEKHTPVCGKDHDHDKAGHGHDANESVALDPSQHTQAPGKAGGADARANPSAKGGLGSKGDYVPNMQGLKPMDPLDLAQAQKELAQIAAPKNVYERFMAAVAGLIEALDGRLENIWRRNAEPEPEKGHFDGDLDTYELLNSEMEQWSNYPRNWAIFEQQGEASKRKHFVSFLLDQSGSMSSVREPAEKFLTALLEVLERKGIDLQYGGFDDKYRLFKRFSHDPENPPKLSVTEKAALIELVNRTGHGSTHDTEAILRLLADAHKAGINLPVRFIAVGIGNEGMEHVGARYKRHVLVDPGNIDALPELLATKLEEVMRDNPHSHIVIIITDGRGYGPAAGRLSEVLERAETGGPAALLEDFKDDVLRSDLK